VNPHHLPWWVRGTNPQTTILFLRLRQGSRLRTAAATANVSVTAVITSNQYPAVTSLPSIMRWKRGLTVLQRWGCQFSLCRKRSGVCAVVISQSHPPHHQLFLTLCGVSVWSLAHTSARVVWLMTVSTCARFPPECSLRISRVLLWGMGRTNPPAPQF
jgi:hypothetical protein